MTKAKSRVDVTVVLNAHGEGRLIHRTIQSISRARLFAQSAGISCEIISILDRPDRETSEYFSQRGCLGGVIHEVDFGDLGLSRNEGVDLAHGKYVAFVDGDDLISENWIERAWAYYEARAGNGKRYALHPEVNVLFGRESIIFPHADQEAAEWCPLVLVEQNYWTALVFASAEDLRRIPYRYTRKGTGFGFEDWDWNCQTIGEGMVHKPVPRTAHFIRRKHGASLELQTSAEGAIVRPSLFFDRLGDRGFARAAATIGGSGVPAGPSACSEGADDNSSGAPKTLAHYLSQRWLLDEWVAISDIEPALYPSPERTSAFSIVIKPNKPWGGDAYARLISSWDPGATHLVLCSGTAWLETAPQAIQLAQAIVASGGKPVVISTDVAAPAGTAQRLPEAGFIDIHTDSGMIDQGLQKLYLTRAALQRAPRFIHLLDSALGWRAVSDYGAALASVSRIIACSSAPTPKPDGRISDFFIDMLPDVIDHFSVLYARSRDHARWLCRTYGLADGSVPVLYPHYDGLREFRPPLGLTERPPRVIWLGEPYYCYLPALFLSIARAMPDVEFVVHAGHRPREGHYFDFIPSLSSVNNILVRPEAPDLDAADMEGSILLHTALFGDIPQVLIEAIRAGRPVVAPDLGGISELVEGKTGYLVRDFDDPMAYARALRDALRDPDAARARTCRAQDVLRQRHSPAAFQAAIAEIWESSGRPA